MTMRLRLPLAAGVAVAVGTTVATMSPGFSQFLPPKKADGGPQAQDKRPPPPKPIIKAVPPRVQPPVRQQATPQKAVPNANSNASQRPVQKIVREPQKADQRPVVKKVDPPAPTGTNKVVTPGKPLVPVIPSDKKTTTGPVPVPRFPDKKVVVPATPPGGGTVQTPGKVTTPLPGKGGVGPGGTPLPNKLPGSIGGPIQTPGKVTLPLPTQLPKGATPIGKTVVPGPLQPFPPLKTQTPGVVKFLPPAVTWKNAQPKPAPGLNLTLIKPLSPGLKYVPIPKAPPPPPKLWVGPGFGYIPPSMSSHPWKGKKVFPYFFVGAAIGAAAYIGYNSWYAPPPSCYVGGSLLYYYPGSRRCFDFTLAVEGDPFEYEGRIYYWQPRRYRTVETLIVETPAPEPAQQWIEKEPERRTVVAASIQRATERAETLKKFPIEQMDCSSCLAALGPIEGQNGEATVSLVNNCEHDVTVSGGLSRQSAKEDDPPVCEFVGEIPKGEEVAACTRAAADFAEAQIFLNAVTPVAGTTNPAPVCRIPDQRAEAPPQ